MDQLDSENRRISLDEYRWPAEWEPHEATWVSWPVKPETWPGIFDRIPVAYSRMVAAIARFEPVCVLAGTAEVRDIARPLLDAACAQAGSCFPVSLIDIPVNDSWCRDHGPIYLTGIPGRSQAGRSVVIDWGYNAWGGKYPPWDLDDLAASRIAERLGVPSIRPGIILEGGAIEGNGDGTVMTTESCLLNPNRNPGMTKERMEEILHRYLRAKKIIWLPGHGILGDDTDGHIDQVARFVDDRRVLVAAPWCDDAEESAELRANFEAVEQSINSAGLRLQPLPLKMPSPKLQDGHRMPACYCNYYLANGGVIVPTFGDSADDSAMQQLQDCYPDRKIVGVDAIDLIWGLGAFHCMTQQQPSAS